MDLYYYWVFVRATRDKHVDLSCPMGALPSIIGLNDLGECCILQRILWRKSFVSGFTSISFASVSGQSLNGALSSISRVL